MELLPQVKRAIHCAVIALKRESIALCSYATHKKALLFCEVIALKIIHCFVHKYVRPTSGVLTLKPLDEKQSKFKKTVVCKLYEYGALKGLTLSFFCQYENYLDT